MSKSPDNPGQYELLDQYGNLIPGLIPRAAFEHNNPYEEQTGSHDVFHPEELSPECVHELGRQALGGKDIERLDRRTSDRKDFERHLGTYSDSPELTAEQRQMAHEAYLRDGLQLPRFHRVRRHATPPISPDGVIPRIDDQDRDNPSAAMERLNQVRRERNIPPRLRPPEPGIE